MAVPDPTVIALIGTLCGGVGLKFVEHFLGRSKIKIDEASKIRDELRVEITAQREEIKTLEADVEKWRKDYYDLRDEFSTAKTEYTIQLDNLKRQLEATKDAIVNGPPT